jgi:DNA repair exonuclease SbcCD ATPase subunit
MRSRQSEVEEEEEQEKERGKGLEAEVRERLEAKKQASAALKRARARAEEVCPMTDALRAEFATLPDTASEVRTQMTTLKQRMAGAKQIDKRVIEPYGRAKKAAQRSGT